MNNFPSGSPLTVFWHFTKPDGSAFSLNGYTYGLYYLHGLGRTEVKSSMVSASGDTLSIVFPQGLLRPIGAYSLQLQLYQNGRLFTVFNYKDAFLLTSLHSTPLPAENQAEATNIVHLYTAAEFYLLSPVIPTVGDDNYWYVNGQIVTDGSGNYVSAEHTVRYDEDSRRIIIDEGRVDAQGESIEQVITDIDDFLTTAEENEQTRQENEQSRIETEGRMKTVLDSIVVNFLSGTDLYEQAVEQGFEGTKEEWLTSTLGVKGVGIESWEIEQSTADSGTTKHTITFNDSDKPDGPTVVTFNVKNGKGVSSVQQTTTAQESEGVNVITVTFSDGTTATFQVKNGAKGNSGYSGAAEDLEVVNGLDADDPEADAAKALSAYQGNVLNNKVTELGQEVLGGDVIEAELNLGNPTAGYYTGRVGETVGETTSNGYKYAAYSLDAYVGKHLVLTIPGASSGSTSRRICICDSAGTIVILYSEADAASAPFEIDIQEGYYLYVSRQSNNGYTATITSHTDGLKDRVEGLEDSVGGLQEGLSDLEENVTEEINGLQDDVTELEKEVNGGTTTTAIDAGTRSSGYYQGRVGETIQATTSNGRKYDPIDLSNYVGQIITISLQVVNPTTSTTRIIAVCDADGKIIDKRGEGYFSDGSSWDFLVESGMYLYVSYNTSSFSSESIIAKKKIKGVANYVDEKFNGVFYPVQIVCDNNSEITRNDFKYCSFCKSESSVIRGVGNSTILVNVNTQNLSLKDVVSFGFLASFDFQDVASISLNGRLIEIAENYAYTESGKLYHIDGDSFNRFNMYANGEQATLTIQVSASDGVEWELLIANNAVINNCMDTAPICLCYDGGAWDGKVVYNNEQISLWRFHEIMGFPYTICFDPNTNSIDNFNEIVKEHISSGFATLMLRHVPYTIGSQHQQPTELELVNKIREEFGLAAFSTSRACVLGQHHFDRKIRRCMTKVGVRALRIQTSIDNYQGYISRLPGDADILCINTCAVNNSIGATDIPFKFPRIAFAHGVGIPPEGESGYADSTGTVTPATFARLKELQESGNVEILNVTDWIAKCGF